MRRPLGLLALLAVIAVVPAGWWGWAHVSAAQVTTSWEPDCSGTDVTTYTESSNDTADQQYVGQPVIDVRPGFRCTIRLTVANESDRTAHLTGVAAPFMGSGGGAEVQGFSSDGTPVRDDAQTDRDAVFPVDLEVAAHSSATIDFVIGWRGAGCSDAGLMSFHSWPTVRFQLLRRDHEATSSQFLILRTDSKDHPNRPGC